MRRLNLLVVASLMLVAAGCIVVVPSVDTDHDGVLDVDDFCPTVPAGANPDPARPGCPLNVAPCNPPTQAASTANFQSFPILAGGVGAIPANDFGFVITANGTGGYRVAYSDQGNLATCFSGILRATGGFDPAQTRAVGAAVVTMATDNSEIRFASVPGANVDGVDMVSQTDPLFVEAFVDGGTSQVKLFSVDKSNAITVAQTSRGAFDPR